MKNTCTILTALLFLSACHRPTVRKNEINKIEIARGDGVLHYPIAGIIIDSTLTYKFYGGYATAPRGCYQGKITRAFWDILNIKLKRINFKTLDTTEIVSLGGDNTEVIFYWDREKRHVFKPSSKSGDVVDSVFRWILNSYKSVQLSKSRDSIKFETTYQYDRFKYPPWPK